MGQGIWDTLYITTVIWIAMLRIHAFLVTFRIKHVADARELHSTENTCCVPDYTLQLMRVPESTPFLALVLVFNQYISHVCSNLQTRNFDVFHMKPCIYYVFIFSSRRVPFWTLYVARVPVYTLLITWDVCSCYTNLSRVPFKTGTLTRSRTYIVVPRDVPPENFISVSETRKVTRDSVCLSVSLSFSVCLSVSRSVCLSPPLSLSLSLGPIACLTTALGPLACLAAALGPLAWLT